MLAKRRTLAEPALEDLLRFSKEEGHRGDHDAEVEDEEQDHTEQHHEHERARRSGHELEVADAELEVGDQRVERRPDDAAEHRAGEQRHHHENAERAQGREELADHAPQRRSHDLAPGRRVARRRGDRQPDDLHQGRPDREHEQDHRHEQQHHRQRGEHEVDLLECLRDGQEHLRVLDDLGAVLDQDRDRLLLARARELFERRCEQLLAHHQVVLRVAIDAVEEPRDDPQLWIGHRTERALCAAESEHDGAEQIHRDDECQGGERPVLEQQRALPGVFLAQRQRHE